MFCKECGAEIPDDSKHCKECGTNLVDESNVIEVQKTKNRKLNKNWLLGCCVGIIVIFLIFSFISSQNEEVEIDKDNDFYYTHGLKELGFEPYKKVVNDNFNSSYYKSVNNDSSFSILEGGYSFLGYDLKHNDYEPKTVNGVDGYVLDGDKFLVELGDESYVRFDVRGDVKFDDIVMDYWN